MEQYFELGFAALFFVSFLAATILPFSSEGFLMLMLLVPFDQTMCLVAASTGNCLGGLTNYFLGSLGNPEILLKWFKVSYESIVSLELNIRKYGAWSALLCWLPFIGDPIAIALGFFRVKFIPVAVLMFIGKATRYAFIVWAFNSLDQ